MLSGIFDTGLTTKDVSVLQEYGKKVQVLGSLLKSGNITQEQYSENLVKLKNGFVGVSTSAQSTAIKIDMLGAQYADGKIGMAEYQAQMKLLEGEMQATSIMANVLGTALRTVFNVGIMIVLNLIITGIMEMAQAEEKAIEKAKDVANTAKEEASALNDLRESYFDTKKAVIDNTKSKEDLTSITETLLKKLGVELDTVEELTAEYGNLDNAINQLTAKNIIDDVLPGLAQGISAAKKELLDTASKDLGFSETDDTITEWLNEWNSRNGNPFNYWNSGWQNNFRSNNSHIKNRYTLDYNEDEALKAITDDIKIYTQLLSDMNKKNFEGSRSYTEISNRLDVLKKQYEALNTAMTENNDKAAEAVLLKGNALNKGMPKTFEAYEKYRKNIIKLANSEDFVNLFKGTAEDIESAIAKQLQSDDVLSAYEDRFQSISSLTKKALAVNIDSETDIKAYLNSLSDDEIDIVKKIPDFFERGLSVATDKIQEWKSKPENKITYQLGEFDEKVNGLSDIIEDALKDQGAIQSAFDKISKGTSLTTNEIVKLGKAFPNLLDKFSRTKDGWTIGTDELVNANKSVTASAREAIEAERSLLQEKITEIKKKLNYENIESLNPDISIIQELTKELNAAEKEMTGWDNLLASLNLDLDDTEEKTEALSKAIKTFSTNVSAGVSAQKEMNESGKISASTLENLISLGEDYIKSIQVENGVIKFNADIFKEITKAKLDDQIADLELSKAEAIRARIEDAMYNKGGKAKELQALIDDTDLKLRAAKSVRDGIDDAWNEGLKDKTSKNDDPIKDAFQKRQKELEHLLNMEQITEAEYYKQLFDSKEYKALLADRTKYADELNSIDEKFYKFQQNKYKEDADKQFDDLEDQYKRGIITAEQYAQGLYDLGQELYGEGSIYGGTEFAIKALEELDKKVKETSDDIYDESLDSLKKNNDGTLKSEEQFIKDWTKLNDDTWKTINPKQWEDNYNEIADYTQNFYKDLLDKGVLNPDQYKDKVQSFFYRLKSMGIDLGKNWLANALEIDDIEYDKLKESLSADGDRTLDDVLADAEKLSEKNIKLFSDDPETLRKNAEDIFKSVSESAKNALDKILITPDEYLQIIDKWGDNLNISKGLLEEAKELSEDDYLDRWDLDNGYDENKSKDDYELRTKRIKYIYKLAEKLYGKNGQKNLKAYNALINQGLEDVESLVEDYYDEEIKKLEEINDEEEKRQKALELQLNLIKARQKLEEAKSQRNQLILENGVFRYDYDQEAVMSAQEDIAEAEKAILEQEREDQKEALENQKEETLKFFNSVGGKLDDFIDRVEKFLAGDKDAFKVNESKTDVKTDVEVENDNNSSDIKDKNIVSKITDISDVTKDTFNIAKTLADNFSFENLVRALGGNPTAEAVKNFKDSYNATLVGKQITPSTLPSNVTNNSSTTNNSAKTVNIGDIHLHLDLTVESLEDFVENKLEQFAQEVGDAFETEILRKMTSN